MKASERKFTLFPEHTMQIPTTHSSPGNEENDTVLIPVMAAAFEARFTIFPRTVAIDEVI